MIKKNNIKLFLGIVFTAMIVLNVTIVNAEEADTLAKNDSTEIDKTVKKIAEITLDRCVRCGLCAQVCPEGAITFVDHTPVIDPSKCTAAETCVKRCPTRAIKMVDYEVEAPDSGSSQDSTGNNESTDNKKGTAK